MSSPPVTRNAVLKLLKRHNIAAQRYLDLGCGDGSLTARVASFIRAKEVIGVDISEEALEKAKEKGIKVFKVNLESDPLPFIDNYFDFITAVDIAEHLKTVDNLLAEASRVLKPGGFFLVVTPNLSSWINRLFLLFGYQPIHTEPSKKYHAGLPIKGVKVKENYFGHVNVMTAKALRSLLKAHNFVIVSEYGIRWYIKYKVLNVIDYIFSRIPSLSHDIIILAQKPLRP